MPTPSILLGIGLGLSLLVLILLVLLIVYTNSKVTDKSYRDIVDPWWEDK